MKLGAENKKAAYALFGLLAVLGYSSFFSGPDMPNVSSSTPVAAPAPAADAGDAHIATLARDEFVPKLPKHKPGSLDENVDPTIHTELLARLDQAPAGSGRDLFRFAAQSAAASGSRANAPRDVVGPIAILSKPAVQVPAIAAPPIDLKYYGIVTRLANGVKTAFFMDGDEILIAREGVTLKGRYRLLHIGVNSAVVEDMERKRTDTLQLAGDERG